MKSVWCNNSVYDGIERTWKMKRKKFVLTDLNHLGGTQFWPFVSHAWVATHTLGTTDLDPETFLASGAWGLH